jgi:hypothetical protein
VWSAGCESVPPWFLPPIPKAWIVLRAGESSGVGPDGTVIPVIPINFFYVASRHGNQWLIEDGRAHFAPAPANSMTSRN